VGGSGGPLDQAASRDRAAAIGRGSVLKWHRHYRWPNVRAVPTLARTRSCRATAKHDTTVLACLPCRA
jgi:hypothetical protein